MHKTLFLIVAMCGSAMPTLASAATCDGQQLMDDLQWAIMDNGQHCASHQAFEDLINGACHRNNNQMPAWRPPEFNAQDGLRVARIDACRVRPSAIDEAKEAVK
jgi:hypothetical protein